LPAGKLETGEEPMEAGIRELREETGYSAAKVEPLGRMIPTGGYNTEVIYLYLATGLTAGEAHPDEGETVEAEIIPFDDALGMVLDGGIEDGKTAYGLMKYKLTRGENK
jgi:ADP-ribose pyrophosphatase